MFSICIAGTFIPFVLRTIPGWMAFTTAHLQRQSQTHESNESGAERRGDRERWQNGKWTRAWRDLEIYCTHNRLPSLSSS